MMPITRRDIEILLDTPERRDYVVSAYVDMRVKDGFHRDVDVQVRNLARAAGAALSEAEARTVLDANVAAIRRAVDEADPSARGLAVFSGAERSLFHAVPLDFPVENYLVIDEDPFVLPLLERWYGEPNYLAAVVSSHEVHLFEVHAGVTEEVRGIHKEVDESTQRDKPRFTYKKRFTKTRHERQHGLEDDDFFKQAVADIAEHWKLGQFSGLILLGPTEITAALRRLLPKELEAAVAHEAAHTMTSKAEDIAAQVEHVLEAWREGRKAELMGELTERWKNEHLVANGPTEVLDALQQGRATQVILGPERDIPGARCTSCGYRFGAPVRVCVYCESPTRNISAAQEILRMALRHRVGVHIFDNNGTRATLMNRAGGVAALLRAGDNWAPDKETARASRGEG